MIHIQKGEEPAFMVEFKKKNPKKTYDSKEFTQYRPLLKKVLVKEQKGICAYCCTKITEEKSHNEHIEPRNPGKYSSSRSLDYYNIVASCNNPNTCGKIKGNKYDAEKFISPLSQDCADKFKYYPDGIMEGDEYTINLLNLNEYSLTNARKAIYWEMKSLSKDDIKTIYMDEPEEYHSYYNVIKSYYDSL